MNMLLFHNSEYLVPTKKPRDNRRPIFYWYADRYCAHIGLDEYMYLFVINPKKDGIRLRARTDDRGFSDLHKQAVKYKQFCEGNLPETKYYEGGIVMSFDEMKPSLILRVINYAKHEDKPTHEVISPRKLFKKTTLRLFDEKGAPIPFNKISELRNLIPDINECLPFKSIQPSEKNNYSYNDWNPMITENNGVWL